MIVAATGHRPDRLGGHGGAAHLRRVALARAWLELVRPTRVLSGMALGWDQAWATAAIELDIPFVAAVPFIGQERAWPAESQALFRQLLTKAAEVVIVSPGGFSVRAMHARNHWLVDHSDLLVALWDGCWGGTGECVAYCASMNKPMVNLWPNWLRLCE